MYFSMLTFVFLFKFLFVFNNLHSTVNGARRIHTHKVTGMRNKPIWQVINGTYVDIRNFPYSVFLVLIDVNDNHWEVSTGSIISEYHFLTTCSSVYNDYQNITINVADTPEVYGAIVGMDRMDRSKAERDRNTHAIEKIMIHPECKGNYLMRDIAVFKVQPAFRFTDKVQPIKLPDGDIDIAAMVKNFEVCQLAGYGARVYEKYSVDVLADVRLMGVSLRMLDLNYCIGPQRYFLSKERHFCMYNKFTHLYKGDSGAGVVCGKGDKKYILGIASSAGIGTTSIPVHSVFTRVDANLVFIRDAMGMVKEKSDANTPNLKLLLKHMVTVLYIYIYLIPDMYNYSNY